MIAAPTLPRRTLAGRYASFALVVSAASTVMAFETGMHVHTW